jgi:predicted O-methyltransferase YrrM
MNSSYNNKVTFGDILNAIVFTLNPKKIVEVGILEGYSLKCFAESSNSNTIIQAYDIFDKFNGNHAKKNELVSTFEKYNNVTINYGDFYEVHKDISNIDIIHIDIANNGDVFEYAIKNYLPKLSQNGIMIMEGGSEQRDNVEWMMKYNKPKIQPVVKKYGLNVVGTFPSITIIKKENEKLN